MSVLREGLSPARRLAACRAAVAWLGMPARGPLAVVATLALAWPHRAEAAASAPAGAGHEQDLLAATLKGLEGVAASFAATLPQLVTPLLILLVVASVAVMARRLGLPGLLSGSGHFSHMWRIFSTQVLTNWRLVLLGLTGLVLSLASGWTTWDGMRNFTGDWVLSLLITFGIQGVMLIAAWLIGESFAQGFARPTQPVGRRWWLRAIIVGATVLGATLLADSMFFGGPTVWTWFSADASAGFDLQRLLLFAGVAVLAGLFGTTSFSDDIVLPYLRGIKTILANLPLWLMFAACMATSVFFSFDSLFSHIFDEKERERAAELRVRNNVAGVVADVGARIELRRREAVERLFASSAWQGYNADLSALVGVAQRAPEELTRMKLDRVGQQSARETAERTTISRAEQERVTLASEQARLLAAQTPDAAAAVADPASPQARRAEIEAALAAKREEIIKAEADMRGEAEGVRGTGQAGRGPKWRELRDRLAGLRLDQDELQRRLDAIVADLGRLDDQRAARNARLEQIATRIAALDVEIDAAKQRLATVQADAGSNIADDLDAAGGIRQIERERATFRRDPTKETYDRIQALCNALRVAVGQVPTLAEQTSGLDCEPEAASEAASEVFNYNGALAAFRENCAAGERVSGGTANSLLRHGNACIQDSGLPGGDTEEFRTLLNRVALNRDDKAHRFVVTANAFNDGNNLAYLALAIAIAVDALVFMSGLFGANVMRSPLAEVPVDDGMTVSMRETMFNAALGENGRMRYANAHLVLDHFKPVKESGPYMGVVDISGLPTGLRATASRILTAGSDLGLVHDDGNGRYHVKGPFYRQLNLICDREYVTNPELRSELQTSSARKIIASVDHQFPLSEEDRLRIERESERRVKKEEHGVLDDEIKRLAVIIEEAAQPNPATHADFLLRLMRALPDASEFRHHSDKFTHVVYFNEAVEELSQRRQPLLAKTASAMVVDKDREGGGYSEEDLKRAFEHLKYCLADMARNLLHVGKAEGHVAAHKRPSVPGSINPGAETHLSSGIYVVDRAFYRSLTKVRADGLKGTARGVAAGNMNEFPATTFDLIADYEHKFLKNQMRRIAADLLPAPSTAARKALAAPEEQKALPSPAETLARQEEGKRQYARLAMGAILNTVLGLDNKVTQHRLNALAASAGPEDVELRLNAFLDERRDGRDVIESVRQVELARLAAAIENAAGKTGGDHVAEVRDEFKHETMQRLPFWVLLRLETFIDETRQRVLTDSRFANHGEDVRMSRVSAGLLEDFDTVTNGGVGNRTIDAILDLLPPATRLHEFVEREPERSADGEIINLESRRSR
ncbi:MAG: hypothetical protein GC150_09995 [Rhizobiales bacterium]|nr:hypothetical protein [Hyphomicrobiales bacterium]